MEKNLADVIEDAWLSRNPGYYDWRNIWYGDIRPEHLKKISDGIAKNFDQKKQEVFHQMVFDLPTLKATYFLDMLYRLTINQDEQWWRWKKHVINHYAADLWWKIDKVCPLSEQIKTDFKKLINRKPTQK